MLLIFATLYTFQVIPLKHFLYLVESHETLLELSRYDPLYKTLKLLAWILSRVLNSRQSSCFWLPYLCLHMSKLKKSKLWRENTYGIERVLGDSNTGRKCAGSRIFLLVKAKNAALPWTIIWAMILSTKLTTFNKLSAALQRPPKSPKRAFLR